MPTEPIDQLGMDETVIEDKALEAALEARADALEDLVPARTAFTQADKAAKVEVERAVPVGAIVRVGRFRVERSATPARHVEFDTEPGARVTIDASDE